MRISFLLLILLSSFTQEGEAKAELQKDYGVVGAIFEIMEEDLLESIERKLEKLSEDGSLQKHQQKLALEAQEKIKRPKPVAGMQHTTKQRSFTYDPGIIVPYDLKDHQGKIFHAKGTKVNPLDSQSLSKPLVFIDGDDGPQVEWATLQQPVALIILTKGSPFELMEKIDRPIYFDQEGVLTKNLGILQVPAKVTQQEKHLLVEEILLEKQGEK